MTDAWQKPKYWILHWNRLLLVTNEDASNIPGQAQAKVTPICLECHPGGFFSRNKFVRKASTILGDLTRRWIDLLGVVEWRVPNEALDTNGARGSTESFGLD